MLSFITNQTKYYKSQTAKLKVEIRLLRQLDPWKKILDDTMDEFSRALRFHMWFGTRTGKVTKHSNGVTEINFNS